MSDITHAISIARRRILLDRLLHHLGAALMYAGPAALALLLMDRLARVGLPMSIYPALVGAALLVAVVMTLARVPQPRDVSIEIDRRLHLKDRIGTAYAIANNSRTPFPGFAPLVLADAQRLAGTLDLRRAIPIRMRTHWVIAALAVFTFALAAWLVPMRQPPETPGTGGEAAPAAAVAARDAIRDGADEIRQSLNAEDGATDATADAGPARDAAIDEQLEQLDAMAEQLAQKDPGNPEAVQARSEASATMNELAEEMASRSQRELESLEELARRFEGIDPPDGTSELDPQIQQFLDSMKQGEFDHAAEALDEAATRAQALDEDARRDAAEQLREMSERVENLARDQATEAPEDAQPEVPTKQPEQRSGDASQEDQLREALEDLGTPTEDIDRMLDPNTQQQQGKEETERELREQGVDEELAEKLARDIEENRKQRDTEQRADERAKEVSDALRRSAENIENPPPPPPEGRASPQAQDQPQQQQGEAPQQDARDAQSEPQREGEQPGEQRQGEQQVQREQESPQGEPRDAGKTEPTGQQQEPKPTPAEQPTDAQQQKQQRESREQKPSEQQPGAEQQQQQQGEGAEPQPGDQPQSPAGVPESGSQQRPGQPGSLQQPEPTPSQSPPPDAPSMLRQLERMRENADRNREHSEKLRERARELADTMSPEERRNLERWADAQQREKQQLPDEARPGSAGDQQDRGTPGSRPGDTPGRIQPGETRRLETDPADADLTGEEADGRTIGELPGDDELIIDPGDRATAAQRNIAAQRAAQRAVEQGEVPSRYHRFIQRYFRQFKQE